MSLPPPPMTAEGGLYDDTLPPPPMTAEGELYDDSSTDDHNNGLLEIVKALIDADGSSSHINMKVRSNTPHGGERGG